MIRAVCWDVGGVFTGSPRRDQRGRRRAWAHPCAAVGGRFRRLAGGGRVLGAELEVGRLSLREAWPLIEERIAAIGIDLSIATSCGAGLPIPSIARSCDTAAAFAEAGLTQAVVTNNVREFADMDDEQVAADGARRHMTVVVDSSVVGMRSRRRDLRPSPERTRCRRRRGRARRRHAGQSRRRPIGRHADGAGRLGSGAGVTSCSLVSATRSTDGLAQLTVNVQSICWVVPGLAISSKVAIAQLLSAASCSTSCPGSA